MRRVGTRLTAMDTEMEMEMGTATEMETETELRIRITTDVCRSMSRLWFVLFGERSLKNMM